MKRSGVSTAVAVGAVVIIVVAAAGTFFLLGGIGGGGTIQSSTSNTTTTSSSISTTSGGSTSSQGNPPPGLQDAFQAHVQKIGTRSIPSILTDYQQNAVLVWQGNAQGLGGTYTGVGNIQLLYAAAVGSAKTMTFNSAGYQAAVNSTSEQTVSANLQFSGTSDALGDFNGTATARLDYVYVNGAWQIKQETWTFKVFAGTNVTEATTFPQWQRAGPMNPARRSTDWLHNFAWDYGGPGTAVLVYLFIGAIAVSFALIKLRNL